MQAFVFSPELTNPLEDDNSPLPGVRQDMTSSQEEMFPLTKSDVPEDNELSASHQGEVVSFNNLYASSYQVVDNEPSSSPQQLNVVEILIYCQNFNRMKSPLKMKEIQINVLNSSFSIIMATETSWDDSVRSEEVFGNRFNVFRDDRNLHKSHKKSGGGVLIAINSLINSEHIPTTEFDEFEQVWVIALIAGEIHIFASVYFLPDRAQLSCYEKFFEVAENILSSFAPESKIHINGDFNQRNADFITDSENEFILLPVVGDNKTLQFIFDKIAGLGLNQINNVQNRQKCFLDFLLTNMTEDFCVTESLTPL
ncbi:uncharacterized protein LOC129777174 [Toxorhynchites rutilus septentrionalis]|uniref:uncharacterized protein LOC129777174 n=1 Tax=Toxorhynchites rutilus septentrionalis TaxID=329112 RepID=UPI0024786542|nr:uncharacterized protein LOC129777174 [Toxorhynchites rutilus septentrionalis]XP_055639257.1 uncharacterized protein LOC129777174 [Toxorhynchites rutilus septentrionalis]